MKKSLLLAILFILPLGGQAQINAVVNPSFEDTTRCPDRINGVTYANYWTCLDTAWRSYDYAHSPQGVPEYFNSSCRWGGGGGVRYGRMFQRPRTGNGVMMVQTLGVVADDFDHARDYLQGRFIDTLTKGRTYEVSFYAVNSEASAFEHNHVGAYIDDGTIDTASRTGVVQSQYTPQVDYLPMITDTLNWTRISDTFTANGTERFITIGSFTSMYTTTTNPSAVPDYGEWHFSWHVIDDVTVIDCGNIPVAGIDTTLNVGDTIHLGTRETLLPYTWYEQGNPIAIDSGSGTTVRPVVTTTYILVQELCGIKRYDTVTVTIDRVGVNDLAATHLGKVQVSPNPVIDQLTITNATNTNITIIDMVGKRVMALSATTDNETINVSTLPKGIYLITITDPQNGEKVVRKVVK